MTFLVIALDDKVPKKVITARVTARHYSILADGTIMFGEFHAGETQVPIVGWPAGRWFRMAKWTTDCKSDVSYGDDK